MYIYTIYNDICKYTWYNLIVIMEDIDKKIYLSVNLDNLKRVTGMPFRLMSKASGIPWTDFRRYISTNRLPLKVAVKLETVCVRYINAQDFYLHQGVKSNRALLLLEKNCKMSSWFSHEECGNKIVTLEAGLLKANEKMKSGNANELEKMSFLINQHRVSCEWQILGESWGEAEFSAFAERGLRALDRRIEESMSD